MYSPYRVKIDNITFYFTSMLHKQKFDEEHIQHRFKLNDSLSNRFNVYVNADKLADIVFYSKVETRGFLIDIEGVKICQLQKVEISVGGIMMKQN